MDNLSLNDEIMKEISIRDEIIAMMDADDDDKREDIKEDDQYELQIEVSGSDILGIKEACYTADYPLLSEYDFKHDENSPNLDIELKPTTVVRPY